MMVPFLFTSLPAFVAFLITATVTDVKCYLMVVVIHISLMINDAEHLFTCMFSLRKCLKSSCFNFCQALGGFLMLGYMKFSDLLDIVIPLVIFSPLVFLKTLKKYI